MRELRNKAKITQVAMAKTLGLSQSTISKLEAGLLVPSVTQWVQFCGSVEVSIEVIMALSESPPKPST